jgi:polyisoprenyl-teichoic acid--peptidoglycan teichoic acid transferase
VRGRRWWVAVPLVALIAWVALGALFAGTRRAGAQAPGVTIKRTQRARFVPARSDQGPLFILAIGSDAREGVCLPVDRCLADSIHVIAVNARKGSATILGFPRDSYVPIPGSGSAKINDALHQGGPELLVQTVEELTGIPIHYYLLTSFEGLPEMVNAVGPITVEIPYAMTDAAAGTDFEPGPQELDGREALAFSRDRHSGPNGDFNRSENQGALMLGALKALREDVRQNPGSLFRWIVAGVQNMATDLSFLEIFDLAVTATTVKPARVTNLVVPGSLGFVGDASVVLIRDEAEAIYRDVADDGVVEAEVP